MTPHWRRCQTRALLLAGLFAISTSARSQDAAARKPQELEKVNISGQAAQSRLAANRNIEVVRNEDLIKFGQVTLGEALTKSGSIVLIAGRNGNQEITLSGLGDGYTQVLLNGSRAPRGFSLDSLPAEAVERVEIIRSPSAEASSRGVAGTINIILKRVTTEQQTTTFKASGTEGWIQGGAFDGSYSANDGTRSLLVQGSDRRTRVDRSAFSDRNSSVDGQLAEGTQSSRGPATVHEATLTSKLEWRDSSRSVSLDALAQASRQKRMTQSDELFPSPPAAAQEALVQAAIRRDTYSATLGYRDSAVGDSGSLETSFTASTNKRLSDGSISYIDGGGTPNRLVSYLSTDNSFSAKGKFGIELSREAEVEVGVQVDGLHRTEHDVLTEAERSDALFSLRVSDTALYGRWIGKWADSDVQAGLRGERLSIANRDGDDPKLNRVFDFIAPQFSLTKSLGKSLPTVSLALTRSMRVPDEGQFSNRTYYSEFNSRSQPDQQGNPLLRPELASSMELSLVSPKEAKLSVTSSVIVKALRHVITEELFQSGDSWIVRPTNSGNGRVLFFDLGVKQRLMLDSSKLYELIYGGKLSVTHSQVSLSDGRRSNIPNAIPYQVTLNADVQRRGESPTSGGLSFVYRAPQKYWEVGNAEIHQGARRLLEAYVARRLGKGITARLSGSNLLQRNIQRSFDQSTNQQAYREVTTTRDGPTVRAALEWLM